MGEPGGQHGQFRKRLDAFTSEAQGIYEGKVEALHHARVASRRLREVLPVVGLEGDTTRKLSRRLKKVTRQLGVVRELDVLMLMIQELRPNARYSSTALERVGAGVEEARVTERNRLTAKLPFVKLQRLARRLERASEQQVRDDREKQEGAREAWVWALEARATRRARRVRSAIEVAGAVYVPERLHDVRIALKKLRYVMELLAEARPERAAGGIAVLKTAQDLLGRLHDLEVLIERVRHEQPLPSPPALTVWHDLGSLVDALEEDCRALHARYMRQRVKLLAIADQVGDIETDDPLVNRRAAS
jgi:CHAD domain-containing protein